VCCFLATTVGMATGLAAPAAAAPGRVSVVVTSEDLSHRLSPEPDLSLESSPPPGGATQFIRIDDSDRQQQFAGLGGGMTDSSAWLLENLPPAARARAMHALFSPQAAHLSFIRVPIGASDFTVSGRPYSYDDLRPGHSDPRLRHFSIVHDYRKVLPALRDALRVNPAARVMASLWSAPAWMKANHSLNDVGGEGKLLGPMYGPLARYFVKFLQAYALAGVPVYSITPQNEPGENTLYPGGNLSVGAEASFIASYLRPALRAAHLKTRIYGYDWDWSATLPAFTAALATGPAAASVSGIAWHCYHGNAEVMSALHQMAPRLDQVISECAEGVREFSTSELLIASFRNWATAINLWNLALTPAGGPVQPPNYGCAGCAGILTVNPRTGSVQSSLDYYELAQLGHFVALGAVRLGSTTLVSPAFPHLVTPGLDDVVFQNPDGQKVLLAFNSSSSAQAFTVQDGARYFSYRLPPLTTATFTW
jgi:glucosylceramidase